MLDRRRRRGDLPGLQAQVGRSPHTAAGNELHGEDFLVVYRMEKLRRTAIPELQRGWNYRSALHWHSSRVLVASPSEVAEGLAKVVRCVEEVEQALHCAEPLKVKEYSIAGAKELWIRQGGQPK